MKNMMIHYYNGVYTIRVDGLKEMRYFFYTKKEAIAMYRSLFRLRGKHLNKILY